MTGAMLRQMAMAVAALAALAACQPGEGPFAAKSKADAAGGATPASRTSTRLVDRDVEAPDVFQVTDQALWDGRPSLGGVWVASPDVKDPERVIMRNPANGAFVIGALFKRERENPGPTLQISSDAAEALGLLAGQPGQISVTALRREEAPEETPDKPLLDSAETVGAPSDDAPAADAIIAGEVETRPLDPAPPAKPGAEPADKAAETAAVAAAALEAPAPKPPVAAPAPAPASGGKAIQIGFFSVEANAKRAVDTLAKAGIPAEVRADSAKGKSYWSVQARGDAAVLKKIKAAGFADAYMLN